MIYKEEMVAAEAARAYAYGEPDWSIDPQRCALLVVDMQEEFVRPGWTPFWIPEATRQIARIAQVIEHCRDKNIEVIYTAFRDDFFSKDRPKTGSSMPNRYSHLPRHPSWFKTGKICNKLTPGKNELVIYKSSYGAFYDTPLETILRNLGKDNIIICGTLTNYCCGMTARQGYERGFKVIFGSDITSTDDPRMHEYELKVLRKGFAKIMTAEAILSALK